MGKLSQKLKKTLRFHKYVYSEYESEVAVHNLKRIILVSVFFSVLIVVYYSLTAFFFRDMLVSPWYILTFVPVLIAFAVYACLTIKSKVTKPRQVLTVTYLLYVVTMAFVIVMSVFPHPDIPSVYYHLFVLIAPVLFIIPAYMQLSITTLSLPVFFCLVFLNKDPSCFSHELFEATTAVVFAIILIIFLTQFRIQTNSLKNKYYILSRIDTLTGVMNKSAGETEFDSYLKQKPADEKIAVLFADLDGFKHINDTYGHLEGDRILRMVGARFISLCGKDDIVCRFGGDEFIIMLKNVSDKKNASEKASHLVEAIRDMDFQVNPPITCSVGIYYGNAEGQTMTEIISHSDAALYSAKRNGRNRYEFYER